jgi:hypothetical protein
MHGGFWTYLLLRKNNVPAEKGKQHGDYEQILTHDEARLTIPAL